MKNVNLKLDFLAKRCMLAAACSIILTCTCFAQDVIVTKDSKRIDAKVTEINVDNVRYKVFDHQDGPTYTLPKSDIVTIIYQNGQVETFVSETSTQKPPAGNSLLMMSKGDLLAKMMVNSPILFQQYQTGKNLATTGWILLGVGGGLSVFGSIWSLYEDEEEGSYFLVPGSLCIATSIPLLIIGGNKKKGAIRDFSRQYSDLSAPKPHFQINLHPNRLGIAYVF